MGKIFQKGEKKTWVGGGSKELMLDTAVKMKEGL